MSENQFCVSDNNNIFKLKVNFSGDLVGLSEKGLYYFTQVDFGSVHVGGKLTKSVFIKNDSGDEQTYCLERDTKIHMTRYAFDCKITVENRVVRTNQMFEVKITYHPIIPGEKNHDKFQIRDNFDNRHVILVKGESVGPKVEPSVKALHFFIFKNIQYRKRTFQVTNTSSMETLYQFDLDSDVFKINKKKGTFQAKKRCFITIEFCPKLEGVYSEYLWCAILNEEPFLIELGGVNYPKMNFSADALGFEPYSIPLRYKTGNDGYFQSKFLQRESLLPLTLKPTHLYFSEDNNLSCAMTNHTSDEVKITWSEDVQGVFRISPQHIMIPPEMSFTFTCQFKPPKINEIYSKTLTFQVHWYVGDDGEKRLSLISDPLKNKHVIAPFVRGTLYLPLPLSLKCAGHSLEKNCHWVAMVTLIPRVIILPPCIGSTNSYRNFLLKSNGRYPVLFNILPPRKSVVAMKPMTGVIEPHSFQIVTAQFNPPSTETFVSEEKWHISLNDQTEQMVSFVVKYMCDIPSLTVGNNNKVEFPCVQVGWKKCLKVSLRNTSLLPLKYTFDLEGYEHIEVEDMEGYIGAGEEYYINMYYRGDLCAPTECNIACKSQAVQQGFLVGKPVNVKVKITTSCAYSQLCALPKQVDFGEVEWNTHLQTQFVIYNFGKAPVDFELHPEETDDVIKLTPNMGTLAHDEKISINLELTAKKEGSHTIGISYSVQATENPLVYIFTISLSCVYSIMQVEEIVDHNFGHLFSKFNLWSLLKIETLNKMLREMKHHEKRNITCFIPDCEVGDSVHFIRLLISNKSKFDMDVTLKRVKLCDCQKAETKSLSFRKMVYNCPHREMVKMAITNTILKARARDILKFEIKFTVPGQNKLCYQIQLPQERVIEMLIILKSITDEVSTLSVYNSECILDLGEVFIGSNNPPLRFFWLYNNSSTSVTYHVDDLELVKLRNNEDFNVLNCYNPIDAVNAYEPCPLVFFFRPIEAREYDMSVPLLLGDNLVELKLHGKGIMERKMGITQNTNMPSSSKSTVDSTVNISKDQLIIGRLPLWSSTERMIFIKNTSREKVFSYCWQPCSFEGIVKVDVNPKEGLLSPKALIEVFVKVSSLSEPCVTHLVVSCKLLDHTQQILHEQSKQVFEQKNVELFDYFTITEKGTEYPNVEEHIVPPPSYFFITLGIDLEIIDTSECLFNEGIECLSKNNPHGTIKVNSERIMKRYIKSLTRVDRPIERSSIELHKQSKSDKPRHATKPTYAEESIENLTEEDVEVISDTMRKIIGQVVFSEAFRNIVEEEENDFSTYYYHFQTDHHKQETDDLEPSKRMKLSKSRKKETKDYLDYPEPGELSEVLKKLLIETLDCTFGRRTSMSYDYAV